MSAHAVMKLAHAEMGLAYFEMKLAHVAMGLAHLVRRLADITMSGSIKNPESSFIVLNLHPIIKNQTVTLGLKN
jgi:hypothetical protein